MKRVAAAVALLVMSVAAFAAVAGYPCRSEPPAAAEPESRLQALSAPDLQRIAALIAETEARRAERTTARAPAPARVAAAAARAPDDAATAALRQVAARVADHYRSARRDLAGALISGHALLVDWTEAGAAGAEARATYRVRDFGADMELEVRRSSGLDAPLGVAFPPGTYGTASRVQELIVLRAPVLVLAAGERSASVRVPIACASFHLRAPDEDLRYELRRLEPDSIIDRLAVALCAGREPPPEAEAQLAVWITRNGITRSQFLGNGGVLTFESLLPVDLRHAAGAARLMRGAGLDPSAMPFFRPERGGPDGSPRGPRPRVAPEEPAPAPGIAAGIS